MIFTLVGRRIDQPGTDPPIFPLDAIDEVTRSVRTFFKHHVVSTLISSAACGADLIALEIASDLGIRRRVVLPFEARRFRSVSVTDRPGNWGPTFDSVISGVASAGDLITLDLEPGSNDSFLRANDVILAEALAFGDSCQQAVNALLVWNGISRGADDITDRFGKTARSMGLRVFEIMI